MRLHEDGLAEFDALTSDDAGEAEETQARVLVTFRLGRQVFAVDVAWVREVVDLCAIAPLPGAPHDVLGMIDLRAEPIAILDLASRLGVAAHEGPDSRIIVFTFGAGEAAVSLGVVADQVLRVCDVAEGAVEPMPETRTGWRSADVEGIVRTDDGTAMLLAVERILCRDAQRPGEFDFG
jgi:purine-binding chemotaxis protein CheW